VELDSRHDSVTVVFSSDPFDASFAEKISVAGFLDITGLILLHKDNCD